MSETSFDVIIRAYMGIDEPDPGEPFSLRMIRSVFDVNRTPYRSAVVNYLYEPRHFYIRTVLPSDTYIFDFGINEDRSYWMRITIEDIHERFGEQTLYAGEVGRERTYVRFILLPREPYYRFVDVYVPPEPEIPPLIEPYEDEPTVDQTEMPEGIAEGLAGIVNNIVAGFHNLQLVCNNIVRGVENTWNGFWSGLFLNLPKLFEDSMKEGIDAALDAVDAATGDSPEWKKEINTKITGFTGDLVETALIELSPEVIGKSPLTPVEASQALTIAGLASVGVHVAGFVAGIAAEAASIGQLDGLCRLSEEILSKLGLSDLATAMIMHPLEPLMMIPARQYWYSQFTPLIPPYADLINMRVKEKITQEDFEINIAYQGYSKEWAGLIWDAHFIAPSYGDATKAFYRGGLDYDQFLKLLERVDLDPEFNKQVWEVNVWEIPPYTDLINMRVKEVIPQSMFELNLRKQGFPQEWASRIWDAHFDPPTLSDILTAWRRRIPVTIPEVDPETGQPTPRDVSQLSLDDVRKLMVLVDLDPRYNTIFETRLYRDPTIRQARYMYEQNAIEIGDVEDLVRRSGFESKYIDPMSQYLTTFQERPFRTTYVSTLASAYIKDVISLDELTSLVEESGYQEGVINWITKTADMKRKMAETPQASLKPKLLSIGELKKTYMEDLIDVSEFRSRLLVYNYDLIDIELLVKLMDHEKDLKEKGRQQVALTISQLLTAWRFQEMDEQELRYNLGSKGLDAHEVEVLINTKKKQWNIGGV